MHNNQFLSDTRQNRSNGYRSVISKPSRAGFLQDWGYYCSQPRDRYNASRKRVLLNIAAVTSSITCSWRQCLWCGSRRKTLPGHWWTSDWWSYPGKIHRQVLHSVNLKVKVKVKVNVDLYSASSWTHFYKALRYGTRSQGILQFYLHTRRSSTNGMNHTCLCLPSQSWYSFTDPWRMEGWVGLGHSRVKVKVTVAENVKNAYSCNVNFDRP